LGAILSGVVADLLSLEFAIAVIGIITFLSGVITAIFMYETTGTTPRERGLQIR
jgi:hypothetical protein